MGRIATGKVHVENSLMPKDAERIYQAQLQQSTTTSRMREQRAIETALFQSNGPWIVVSNLEQDMPPVEKETLAGQIAPTLQAQ